MLWSQRVRALLMALLVLVQALAPAVHALGHVHRHRVEASSECRARGATSSIGATRADGSEPADDACALCHLLAEHRQFDAGPVRPQTICTECHGSAPLPRAATLVLTALALPFGARAPPAA